MSKKIVQVEEPKAVRGRPGANKKPAPKEYKVGCPQCKAKPNKPCVTSTGNILVAGRVHRARIDKYKDKMDKAADKPQQYEHGYGNDSSPTADLGFAWEQ